MWSPRPIGLRFRCLCPRKSLIEPNGVSEDGFGLKPLSEAKYGAKKGNFDGGFRPITNLSPKWADVYLRGIRLLEELVAEQETETDSVSVDMWLKAVGDV